MQIEQIEAIDAVVRNISHNGPAQRGSIIGDTDKECDINSEYIVNAIPICEGYELITETSIANEFALTAKGVLVADMGFKEYDVYRKSKSILESEYFQASITSYKDQRKIMKTTIKVGVITAIVAILSITANLIIAFYY